MIRSLLVAVLALFASTVSAQGTYPDHPIRMILPFSAAAEPTRWAASSPRRCRSV